MVCQPLFHLLDGVGVFQISQPPHLGGQLFTGAGVHADGLTNQLHVYSDTPIVDLLVEMILVPDGLRHREPGQLLLDGHLRFHIPEVVGFEPFPFLRGVLRVMAIGDAVPVLGWCAEVADEVFALFQLLLLQAEDSAHTLQREGKAQGRRPHHRAAPGVRLQILAHGHPQPAGQAHTLELSVESPLGHGRVSEGRQHFGGELLSNGEVHHPDRSAVCRVAEQQDFKIRGCGILIYTAFVERRGGKRLNIATEILYLSHQNVLPLLQCK